MTNNLNNNYSDLLRLRSHEFYERKQNKNETTFSPIFRSNSSLSLDSNQKKISFKDFQELRECRFGSDVNRTPVSSTSTSTTTTASTTPKRPTSKSLTSQSLQLSISSENLTKIKSKSKSKSLFLHSKKHSKEKSFFSHSLENNSDVNHVKELLLETEEMERKQRLRQMFIHYDIQSSLSCDEMFLLPNTCLSTTTTGSSTASSSASRVDASDLNSDENLEENEFNSNSLLGFSSNFRNEIGKELVFCLQLRRETDDDRDERRSGGRRPHGRRQPIHSTTLSRQLSCLSSHDMNESQSLLSSSTSQSFCPFDRDFDFSSNVLEIDFGINYYRKYFYGFSHQNWFQVFENQENNSQKTSIALSVRKDSKDLQKIRIILRTNHSLNSLKGFIKTPNNSQKSLNLKQILELLFPKKWTKNPEFLNGFRLGLDSKSDELLLKFDELLYNNCYKIGILYSRDTQSSEEEFYNNKEVYDPDFQEFLSIIGSRVRLKDYQGFRAGLDVTTDTTGRYSYSTKFQFNSQTFDIMYHVMSELPFTPNNTQQLLRKRHIGNDIVTVVFQSRDFRGQPFNPSFIRSHFQHVFLVVRPVGRGLYRVAVAREKGVPPFGPPLKDYYTKSELKDFLLTKILNAEMNCHKVNKFKQMALRTRFEYLNDLFLNYSTQTSIHSLITSSGSHYSGNNNTSQQLLQFSTNFNQFFSQIFSKNKSKESSKLLSINDDSLVNNSSTYNSYINDDDLCFGAKVYEVSDKKFGQKLLVKDFSRDLDLEINKLLINEKFLIIISTKNRIIFTLKWDQMIGWILSRDSREMKIYLHFGELLLLREVFGNNESACSVGQHVLQELKDDFCYMFSKQCLRTQEIKEILLKRKSIENSFGFHIQSQNQTIICGQNGGQIAAARDCPQMIVITEVNEHALKVNQLLKGQRIVELCEISLITLSYEQILDLLKTSQSVSVAVVQPNVDGSPRRGCFHSNCGTTTTTYRHDFKRSLENISLKINTNSGDYENISVVLINNNHNNNNNPTTASTTTTTTTTTLSNNVNNSNNNSIILRHQQLPHYRGGHHVQRHNNTLITSHNNNINNNVVHSSQSSTTSSTLQEDLIKLITLNDLEDDDDHDVIIETTADDNPNNDSHSSSRYSTATSTPYSSLERRHERRDDDCVVTVAKPAFVVNVNEFVNNNVVDDMDDKRVDDHCSSDIEWPSLVATATRVISGNDMDMMDTQSGNDFELKEKVKELSKERQKLNETIRQLKEENQRLHFESQTASQQLRKFTEWFFNHSSNE